MLGLELLKFVFEVLHVLLFAFAEGTLRSPILSPATLIMIRLQAILPDLGRTYDAHVRHALFVLLRVRSSSSSVFQLRLSEVCEFDGVDDLRLRIDILGIRCWTWVCVVSAVEAPIHLQSIWSVLGFSAAGNS